VKITDIFYEELRKQGESPHFVQWITATKGGELIILGWCVREAKTWKTLFQHKDKAVCRKVCDMLNEGEVTKC
jgi:hypothetical protein